MEPWRPTTYVKEAFTQQLPVKLENAWRITNKEMTYLGNISLKETMHRDAKQTSDISAVRLPLRATSRIPPDKELNDTRKAFARVLQQEGVLQYLTRQTNLSQQPYIVGWTSQGFIDIAADGNVNTR